jgi:hypothetical protein
LQDLTPLHSATPRSRVEGAGHAAPFDATTNFVQLIADATRNGKG